MEAITRRFRGRAYRSKPIPQDHLDLILQATRLAPSACNQQPGRFAVVRDSALCRRIVEEGFLPGINMDWALEAPAQAVVDLERSLVIHRIAPSVSGVDDPWVDIGIAGEQRVLAATEFGVSSCGIGWIRPKVIARIVGWPGSIRPVVVITAGYLADADRAVPPAVRRKPVGELVKCL